MAAVAHAAHMGNPSLTTNAMIMSALQQQMLHLQDLEQANALSSMPMSLTLPASLQPSMTVTPHHAGHGTMAAMMYMRDHPAAAAAMAVAAAAASGAGDDDSSGSRRWSTRIEASEAIKSYVAAQGYRAMVDRHNKGGSAVTFRCSSAVKEGSNCSLLIRLRKSKKHNDWYIAGKFCLTHTCHQPHQHMTHSGTVYKHVHIYDLKWHLLAYSRWCSFVLAFTRRQRHGGRSGCGHGAAEQQ
jgi:hypothetical protein